MHDLSVIILSHNDEKNILDCLESIKNAGEVIIIDDNSKDRTIDVARSLKYENLKIYEHELDNDFSAQRNFALGKAKSEWVLFLDADERVSRELWSEINLKINSDGTNGFYIKRVDHMWGRQLNYGELGNIKLLRLAKKGNGKWKGRVHEVWNITGDVKTLESVLNHYPHQTIADFLSEISFYSTLRALELKEKGVKVGALQIIFYPKAKFFVNYFLKLGFLDGTPGLIVSVMMSLHSFLTRSKLWLLNQKSPFL